MRNWTKEIGSRFGLLFAAFLIGLGSACVAPPNRPPIGPPHPTVELSSERFKAGDKITVILSDFPGGPASYEQQVSDDGSITLHLNQRFLVAGKLTTLIQQEIHQRFVPDYYTRMTVVVKPREQYFFIDGYVRQGGNRYPYSSGMTVLKAISTAGGFNEFAEKRKVELTRSNGRTHVIDCEKAQKDPRLDLLVYPGDRISVPRVFF